MAVTIETVNIGGTDKRMALSNASVARVLSIGNNWTKIRILTRCAVDDTGASLTGTPIQAVGMMSNPDATVSNGPIGSTTSHFVGSKSAIATWTRATAPNRYYLSGGNSYVPCKRVGNVDTTVVTGNFAHISATPATIRCVWGVEITKGSPNFGVSPITFWYNPTGMVDMANGILEQGLIMPLLADMAAFFTANAVTTTIAMLPSNIAVDENVDGPLNALVVGWNRVTPVLHVSEILFAKLA